METGGLSCKQKGVENRTMTPASPGSPSVWADLASLVRTAAAWALLPHRQVSVAELVCSCELQGVVLVADTGGARDAPARAEALRAPCQRGVTLEAPRVMSVALPATLLAATPGGDRVRFAARQ